MTNAILWVQDALGTVGWVAVWLLTLTAGVGAILRGRSGAGACLGAAAILGLALQICGGAVVDGLRGALDGLPLHLGHLFALFVRSLGDALVYSLIVAGALLQRPPARP